MKSTRARWAVIGGIAVIARGIERFTNDVDVVVRGDDASLERVVAALRREDIVAREADAERFARESLVFLARHAPTGIDVDVSFAWSAFEHEALDRPSPTAIGRVRLPVARPEDLVIYKAVAGRPKDIEDAEALLLLYPKVDRRRIARHVAALAEIANAPEYVERLERLFAKAQPSCAGPGSQRGVVHTNGFVEPEVRGSREKPKAGAAEFGLDASGHRLSAKGRRGR